MAIRIHRYRPRHSMHAVRRLRAGYIDPNLYKTEKFIKTRIKNNFYSLKDNYWVIFGKSILWLALGAALGFLFFYFFKDQSVYFINKFKFFQSIFGIREYKEGMIYTKVLLTILAGNLISTGAYFALGYLRMLIPITIITGFFIVLFLMTGMVRHLQAVPLEVTLLASLETFYRILATTTGGHLQKNKLRKKSVLIVSLIGIVVLLGIAAYYEMVQIFR
ncbi:MAG: hypothetical protein M1365_11490 [Actinobacteria bacterium]|nr:hypothetical protein [Actinomycetota bacterium]